MFFACGVPLLFPAPFYVRQTLMLTSRIRWAFACTSWARSTATLCDCVACLLLQHVHLTRKVVLWYACLHSVFIGSTQNIAQLSL